MISTISKIIDQFWILIFDLKTYESSIIYKPFFGPASKREILLKHFINIITDYDLLLSHSKFQKIL